MGYAQDLLNQIALEEHTQKRKEQEAIEQEVEEEFCLAMQQELSGNLNYNRSAQKLIDQVK